MEAPHLNLFYSYNRDNELIENNLTRAWIVTLRMLSPEVRRALLVSLLKPPVDVVFTEPQFSLQGYMDLSTARTAQRKYVVALATSSFNDVSTPHDFESGYEGSIPDAWIYDAGGEYCYLVEAKVGDYPLTSVQLRSHAAHWLGLSGDQFKDHLVSLTWFDVLDSISRIQAVGSQQERQLLENLVGFLGYYGYRLFTGFDISNLQLPPDDFMMPVSTPPDTAAWLDPAGLFLPPDFTWKNG